MLLHFMLRFYGRVFRAPILYNTHRAVIFAIAQLSCLFLFGCVVSLSFNEAVLFLTKTCLHFFEKRYLY